MINPQEIDLKSLPWLPLTVDSSKLLSTRIDFDTIEKLCRFIQIQITDLLDLQLDQQ